VSAPALPAPFAHLAAYAAWALPSEDARMRDRLGSSMDDMTAFYQALLPEMPAIAAHLDQWPLAGLPAAQRPLLYLALAFMEAGMAVEAFHDPDVPEGIGAEHVQVFPGRAERLVR
jgi:hypothetical protein